MIRVRAALTFDSALEMLRGNRDEDLQKFIFQEARKELTKNDKIALGALSFFIPSAAIESWMQVAKLSRNALETTIDRLGAMSLIDVLSAEGQFALHPLTRVFARTELLAEAEAMREVGMSFVQFWVDYVKKYGAQQTSYYMLRQEMSNLETAEDWLWENSGAKPDSFTDKDLGNMLINLAESLSRFLWSEKLFNESTRLNERASIVARLMDQPFIGFLIDEGMRGGLDRKNISQDHIKEEEYLELLAVAQQTGSRYSQAIYAHQLGRLSIAKNELISARKYLEQALSLARWLGYSLLTTDMLCDMSILEESEGNLDVAVKIANEAFELNEKIGYKEGIAITLVRRGRLARAHNNRVEEHRWFEQALELAKDLGQLALNRRQWIQAFKWFEYEFTWAQEIGQHDLVAEAQYSLARVYKAEGDLDLALQLAQEALNIYKRLQHKDLAEVQEFVEKLKKAE